MMLKLVFIWTGTAISLLLICEVESNAGPKFNFDDIVSLLKQDSHNNLRQKPIDIYNDGSTLANSRISDDEDNSNNGSLTSEKIIELIQQATQKKNQNEEHNSDVKDIFYSKNYQPMHYKHFNKNRYQHSINNPSSNDKNQLNLEQLFSYYDDTQRPQNDRYREKPDANNIMKSLNTNKIRNKVIDNLDDYSKVYIILDPLAIQNSKSKDELGNLITKVLSSSNQHKHRHGQKKQYYKELPVVGDLLSRRLRDSRESFGPKDSVEANYKQKRSRNDHGGGGGNGGGRTAIPYIRQLGDIYERDN